MMKIRSVILLLTGIFACIPASAQEKDRGYWSLTATKTLYEGKHSNGDNTGIIGGSNRKAEFKILHEIMSTFNPDGTHTVSEREGVTRINIGGTRTPGVHNVHRLTISWSPLPEYVKVGEENKISIDVRALLDGQDYSPELLARDLDAKVKSTLNGKEKEYSARKLGLGTKESYTTELSVSIMPEFTIRNTVFGFDMMNRSLSSSNSIEEYESTLERVAQNTGAGEDEVAEVFKKAYANNQYSTEWDCSVSDKSKARLSCQDAWEQHLPLGKESCMMVSVSTTFSSSRSNPYSSSSSSSYTICQFYLYKYYPNGGDVEKTVRADDDDVWKDNGGGDDGESEGTPLPPWVIPTAIGTIGAFVGYKMLKKRRKGDDEEETEEEEEEDDEPKKPSTYKMILYKNFGSTIMVGDEPKVVGARIEEITFEGKRIERHDLTQQIEIEQGNNIKVVQTAMLDKYRAATVKVEQLPKEEPYEGDIRFIFRAPGGALINKVVFNIEDGRIQFFQPNLTLPTDYQEVARLPFKIFGASDNPTVTVRFDTKEYNVEAHKGKEEEKDIWYAHITENHSVIPPKKDRKPGDYTVSHLQVEVKDANGHTIEGSLPVMRYNMGLVFKCDPFVRCYAEEYDPEKHPFKISHKGHSVSPAISEATYFLLTWDEKEHQLRRVVPADKDAIFEVRPLPEDVDKSEEATDYLSKQTRDMTDQDIIDSVGLQFYINEILDDGSSICCVYARGMLDAPARRKVRLHVECIYKEEKYEAEQDVWLTSQPVRRYDNPSDELEASRLDERMTDNLTHICKFILDHDLLDRIGAVYKLAQIQLDGYDPRFGYDKGMCELIKDTFLRFVNGETLGANATPEGVEYLGIAAELLVALAKTNQQVEAWLDDHGGVWTRVALGVATLGWSEPFQLALRVADKMVEKANHPTKPGGFLETFWVGVVEVGQYYAYEQIMAATTQIGGEMIAKYRPDIAANASRIAAETAGEVQKKLGIFGKDVRVLAKDMKNFATDKFGRQMKSRLNTTKTLNKNAARSSEEVIRKFRQNSQWTPEEILEDELARAANTAAVKEIKEMEHACLDYIHYRTPETKEAFRKFCYKMQSNKIAQKQLSLYKSDWANNVRSEYYRMLQEDYRIVDREALKNACKRLQERGIKVNEDDLFVFCATNSDSTALFNGDALTRDRDLSMMYNPKPTKGNPRPLPREVPQDIAEECYGAAYKKRTGMTMEQGDQAVVQKGSKEMIGAGEKDLNRGFKKEHFSERFDDLDGVARAFQHKPEEWIRQGARLRAAGDVAGAIAKEEEGLRQAIKLYFNSMEKRATYRGTISRIKPKEIEMFNVMKRLEIKTQDPMSISVTDFKKILRSEYKMDITDVPTLLKDLVYRLEA